MLGTFALVLVVIITGMARASVVHRQAVEIRVLQARQATLIKEMNELQRLDQLRNKAFADQDQDLLRKGRQLRDLKDQLAAMRGESLRIAKPMIHLAQQLAGFRAENEITSGIRQDKAARERAWKKVDDLAQHARRELVTGAIRTTVVCEGNLDQLTKWADPETMADVAQQLVGEKELPVENAYGKTKVAPFLAFCFKHLPVVVRAPVKPSKESGA